MSLAVLKNDDIPLPTVLVVEDDQTLREALSDTLELADYAVVARDSAESALRFLEQNSLERGGDVAMVVSDVNMGGMNGHELLTILRGQYPHIPVLLITAYGSVSQSVMAMREGAVDYLVKPFEPQVLVDAVNRYASAYSSADDHAPVAVADSSQRLLQLAQRVAQSDSTVLIIGESGTGKEVLARYVHAQSARAEQPFVAINCAAIPENMLEAMLFGHEKGAYTGAYSSAPGKFEQANGGTLLLDEISEMDLGLQAKLLRVLQEKEVERLGGRKTIALDVRVIATSNRNLQQAVSAGQFREDLYYRLSVLPLQWLPLRERPQDIVPLAEQLLSRHVAKQHRNAVALSASARQALLAHLWPGNVRELDNVIQRALILQLGQTIEVQDLGLDLTSAAALAPTPVPSIAPVPNANFAGLGDSAATALHSSFAQSLPAERMRSALALGADLKQREFEIIVDALRKEAGSRKGCAVRLGISPRTLRYKIAKLREQGLDVNAAIRCG